jgi:C2 domain
VFRSQYINDHLNPLWDEFTLSLEELCYGDINWPMKITVYDYNRNGTHKEIGGFETSIHEMSQRVAIRGNADREVAFELLKEDTNNNNARTSGLVVVLQADIQFQETSVAQSYILNSNNIQTSATTKSNDAVANTVNYATTTSAPAVAAYKPDPPAVDANPYWQSSLQEV